MKIRKPISRSGRFDRAPTQEVTDFSESVSFDWRLWRQDILGSMAHAAMLCQIGVLNRKELKEIVTALDKIGEQIVAGKFRWRTELEDVHMNIEDALTRMTPAGGRLHTARSRNDQVALDMRMWLREETLELMWEIRQVQRALVELADRYPDVFLPGYTHLQRAQPVVLGHHLLAYVEMFERDHQRYRDAWNRINICPLGSGALAGSTLPIDREFVARQLGFVDQRGRPRLTQNSMDAVSDRDFVVEFCSAAALMAVHLSRFAEDVVLWNSAEFNYLKIADDYTTGSSLMPQKKNPDIAELTRGKTGRVIGNLVSLLTTLKGLPMTYNRDLQEDKERLFDTADTVRACLRLTAAMVSHTSVNSEVCARAVADPLLLATDLAEYLVLRGVPFREAHHAVGRAVAVAERKRTPLNQLSLAEFRRIHPSFEKGFSEALDLHRTNRRRVSTGSTGGVEVRKQVRRWKRFLLEKSKGG